MWPFSKKSPVHKLDDKVWMSFEKKYSNLLADAKKQADEGQLVFLACYFSDTSKYIAQILDGSKITYVKTQDGGSFEHGKINLIDADAFQSKIFVDKLALVNPEILILFAEHYPLSSVEKEIFDNLGAVDKAISYSFYLSLDEPLFMMFGAERIRGLMDKMGMEKDEMISHPFISNAILNAQKKIESKVNTEIKSDSMKEWYEKNYKSI